MSIFSGLSAFPVTPADAQGRADLVALERLLTRLPAAGVDSVGLLGSTGTYAYLTVSERMRVTESAVSQMSGKTPLIVGIGALRTDDAAQLARHAAKAGADALLLAPMSYTPLTEDEVFAHFETVAAASDLPLAIYNNPGTTHFCFSLALLEGLAALPTVQAVKMPLPGNLTMADDLARLRDALPDGFVIGYSGDWGCAEALLEGADAWFSVLGGILPGPCVALARAAMAGDRAKAARIDSTLAPLWALFKEFGSLRVVYAIVNRLGLSDAQPPRPILPLQGHALERLETALDGLARDAGLDSTTPQN